MGDDEAAIARRAFERFNEAGIDAVEFAVHPEAEITPFSGWTGPSVYHGIPGIRELADEWTEAFDDYSFEIERVTALQSGAMLLYRQRGRIKGADDWISMENGSIWDEFEDGRARRIRFFRSWEEAEAAAEQP